MTGGLWQKLDLLARSAAPAAVTLLMVLLGVTPLYVPFYGPVAPMLPLMAVFYWAVHRPDLMPFSAVFAAGVLQDVVTGAPFGLHAFILLACHWLVFTQRRFLVDRSFPVMWWGFMMVASLAVLLEWLTFSVFHTVFMPAEPLLFRALLTVALYPLVSWAFIQVHRGFLRQS